MRIDRCNVVRAAELGLLRYNLERTRPLRAVLYDLFVVGLWILALVLASSGLLVCRLRGCRQDGGGLDVHG